jgi:hypothetical protein
MIIDGMSLRRRIIWCENGERRIEVVEGDGMERRVRRRGMVEGEEEGNGGG